MLNVLTRCSLRPQLPSRSDVLDPAHITYRPIYIVRYDYYFELDSIRSRLFSKAFDGLDQILVRSR